MNDKAKPQQKPIAPWSNSRAPVSTTVGLSANLSGAAKLRLRWLTWHRSKLDPATGCWVWQAAKYPTGYGALKFEGKVQGAHRISYAAFHGPIPHGCVVMHKCDNPICCNPDHLEIGTHSDNMADMHRKGRGHRHRGVPIPNGARAILLDDSLSHAEVASEIGVGRDQVRSWRAGLGIDRKHLAGPTEAWKRRKPRL